MKLVSIGKTLKSFGVKGLLKVNVKDAFITDFEKADVVFIQDKDGRIPYFVEAVNTDQMTVKLEEIDSNEVASKLSMSPLFLKSTDVSVSEDTDGDEFQKLVGFKLVDKENVLGEINDIIEYPSQIMAMILVQNNNVLIPLNEAFILKIDTLTRTVYCDLPDGIIDTQL